LVLVLVEPTALLVERRRPREARAERSLERGAVGDGPRAPLVEQRAELLQLRAQEVPPGEGAAPQEPRELTEPLGASEEGEGLVGRPAREHAVEELVERAQRAGGVGSGGEEERELVDEHDGEP